MHGVDYVWKNVSKIKYALRLVMVAWMTAEAEAESQHDKQTLSEVFGH